MQPTNKPRFTQPTLSFPPSCAPATSEPLAAKVVTDLDDAIEKMGIQVPMMHPLEPTDEGVKAWQVLCGGTTSRRKQIALIGTFVHAGLCMHAVGGCA